MSKKLPVPVGRTDYKEICTENYYVDKTLLIKDILDEKAGSILFTRPRRFGKTLNMDMLRTFFEKSEEDTSCYFKDKNIWQQGEEYTKHQGQYPVIFLSLKDIKARKWATAFELLKSAISLEYARHPELETSEKLSRKDLSFYNKIVDESATEVNFMLSLQALSRMLHMHHGKAPVIIIDEYDTPISEGYMNGYYDDVVEFIRNFFSAALKDNSHSTLSVLTGILRIAKESIFSGLNNIRVYSVLDRKFSAYFGFTLDEVQTMAAYYNKADKVAELKKWYDGYMFGQTEIFNPWSVLCYFNNDCLAMPYWVQTSANAIIHELLKTYNDNTYNNLQSLLSGKKLSSLVETNIIYPKLKEPQTNILGFLLMTGYLKSTQNMLTGDGAYSCELELPNKEIRTIYRKEIMSLLTENLGEKTVNNLAEALLHNDVEQLKTTLNSFMMATISYFDNLQENYYHGLMLGLITVLEDSYYLRSNRESGHGRYDIQLAPKRKGLPGIIIEIKAAAKDSSVNLKDIAQTALKQIEEKKYDTELRSQGISNILKYGIAFCNKKVEVVTN